MKQQGSQPKFAGSSKTVALNAAAPAIVEIAKELFPQIQPWISSHPTTMLWVLAGLNVLARKFTAGGLTLRRSK